MHKAIGAFIVAVCVGLLISMPNVEAHSTVHKEVVRVQGVAFCPEDERLVPVKHHGYNAESVSGWTYTCQGFEIKKNFAP